MSSAEGPSPASVEKETENVLDDDDFLVIQRNEIPYVLRKSVLVRESGFFKMAIKHQWKNNVYNHEVNLAEEHLSERALKVIVAYLSSTSPTDCLITNLNLEDTLFAANYLLMPKLASLCVDFVRANLPDLVTFSRCMKIWKLGAGCVTPEVEQLRDWVEGAVLHPAERFRFHRCGQFDLEIKTGSFRLKVHRNVLENACSLIQQHPPEPPPTENALATINLSFLFKDLRSDKDDVDRLQALLHFAQFPYDNASLSEVTCDTMPHLEYLANRFEALAMKRAIASSTELQTADLWVEHYRAAVQARLKKRQKEVMAVLFRRFKCFWREAAKVLTEHHAEMLVKSDKVAVECEDEVLDFVLAWTQTCPDVRKHHLMDLLKHIRFCQVTPAKLAEAKATKFKQEVCKAFSRKGSMAVNVKKRAWPKCIVMVEMPHPRLHAKSSVKDSNNFHVFDFDQSRWSSFSCPPLEKHYSAAFDFERSALHFVRPHPGREELTVTTVNLSQEMPKGHKAPSKVCHIACPGAKVNMTSLYMPSVDQPLLVTPAMPTTADKAYVFQADLRNEVGSVVYEPVSYPPPETYNPTDLPKMPLEDAELTQERTYDVRTLYDPKTRRGFLFSPSFRDSPAKHSVVRVFPGEGDAPPCTHQLQNTFDRQGDFEASFCTFRGDVVRLGGWSYGRSREGDKIGREDLQPEVKSSRAVHLFDGETFQHKARFPEMLEARDSCGAVEHEGKLFVVGGVRRSVCHESLGKQGANKHRMRHWSQPVNQMEFYCETANKWKRLHCNFPHLKVGHVVAFLADEPTKNVASWSKNTETSKECEEDEKIERKHLHVGRIHKKTIKKGLARKRPKP